MTKKFLLPLSAVLGAALLSGCAQTGPLPTFGKTIVPEWIVADFDGQKGDEYIATSNLQDVVFNERGEIIGWYIKSYAGTPFIRKNGDGTYNFDQLKGSKAIVSMVGSRKALAVQGEGLDPKAPAETEAAKVTLDLANNRQDATFRYTQNGVQVTKTVTLHPRNFKLDVKTAVTGGPEQVQILFPGLGKADNPRVQAVPVGGQPATVQGSGTLTVENIRYAALQEAPSQVAHALIVTPQEGTQVKTELTGGSEGLITATLPAQSSLEVYGGKNELVHLYQSGYTELPGLFKPNFFGDISLLIVKLMETLYKFIGNWGLVIMALTILLRLVMWPLMQAQGRTTAKMQIIQPLQKEIQERYKGKTDIESQRAMQMEMAALMREHQVNPAGCFSTLLPFPVLIALWSTIRNFEFDSGFLWLPDLAIPDPFYILAALYMVVNLGQLYVSTRKTPEMFQQQAIMYLMFLYIALTFPAGVTIYTILSTIIGIAQQILINKQVEKETAHLNVEKVVAAAPVKKTKLTKTVDEPKK